jgi:hypothetical protein
MKHISKWLIPAGPLALAMSMVMTSGSALAAQYDGTDPNSTGCATASLTSTVYSVSNVDGFGGFLELRWSGKCDTAWARFTCHASNGCFNFRVSIVRDDGASESVEVPWPDWMWSGDQIYTLQLNDGSQYTAQACYLDENRGTERCTPSF